VLKLKTTAQDRKGRFGQGVSLTRPQGAVRLEERRHHSVGGLVQAQDRLQQGGSQIEKSARMHRWIIPVRPLPRCRTCSGRLAIAPNTAQNDAS
jgi:hypothetical protein